MSILADFEIRQRLRTTIPVRKLVIEPFAETTKEPGKLSHGLTSYGYDLRLGRNYKIFHNNAIAVVDPLNFEQKIAYHHEGDSCIIPHNGFVLAESLEYFEIPPDCLAIIVGKSTYARCGISLTCTPLEPGWKGVVTLEIANHTPLPARVHSGQGIGQVLFFQGSICNNHYGKKLGASYQDQTGLTLPKV